MINASDPPPVADLPLVLHVIPTSIARGAQREARALADTLESPGTRHHRVLSLFEAEPEVAVDATLGHRGGASPAVGFDPRLVLRLRATLAAMDPEVVVAHGSEPLKYLVPAMVGRHRPLVYYAIGTYSGSRGSRQVKLWRYLLSRADVVVVVGDEVLEECHRLLAVPTARLALAGNGRDPEVFRPGPDRPRSDPVLLFVGALTKGKRPDQFIRVVARIRERGVPVVAKLIGDGPLRQELVDPATAAGVELLGPRSDVADQMRSADLLVFPSRPAGEGMPGVLIEAALSGIPAVATAVPGVRSIVKDGETGFVVPVDDVDALAAAVTKLLDDGPLRRSMGEAARAHGLDHFSLAAAGARWLPILQPLIESSGRARRPPKSIPQDVR